MKKVYFFLVMLFVTSTVWSQVQRTQAAFTPGNLVVFRAGDGAAALAATGTVIFIDEYTTSGTLVQSIPLPITTSGSNRRIVCVGNATTEGMMSRSADGQYLVVAGYDAAPGTASLAASTSVAVNRVVAQIDNTATINTTTALTDAISGGNPRGVCSTNGTDIWISGTSSGGGVRYTTLGSTTSISLATTPTNLRSVNIFGGQLYSSSQSGAFRLTTVGTGTPTTAGQTITNLPGFPTATGSPYGYYFADLDAGVAGLDVVYVADDGSGTGFQKYSLVGGVWVANGNIPVTGNGLRGITATVSGTTVTMYGTNGVNLVSLTDASGYNATISGTVTTLAAAGTNTAFRGIAFAPVPTAAPVLSALPGSLTGFVTQLSTPSSNQSFGITGNNLSPASATITITSNSPANIEISPTGLGGSFVSSFTINASGGIINPAVPVYVRLTGATAGPVSGTITVSGGTASSQNVTVNGAVIRTFYSQSSGSLATPATWGTNTNGSGTAPTDFISDGQVFVVAKRLSTTLDANWTVSGASSKVVTGDGISATELVIPAGFTLTGPVDVANSGTLNLQNSTLPTLGALATGSTVEYAQTTATNILNTTTDLVTYSNLRLSNSGLKSFKNSTTTVTGNLIYDGSTNGPLAIEAASVATFTTVNLGGNLTYLGTVTNPVDANSYTLVTTGTGTQTITGNGNTARFFRITANTSGNNVVLSTTGGTTNALLGNLSGGGLTLNTGTTIALSGNTVTFFAGTTTSVAGAGTITGSPSSNIVINKIGTTAFGTMNFTSGSALLNNLTVNITSTTPTVTLGTSLDLSGTLTLTAGKILLGANNLSTPSITGSSSSNYIVTNGTGALTITNVGASLVTFPVGPSVSLYHPATINNAGTVDNFSVKVASAAPPCAAASTSVNATWDIAEAIAGGSNCAITLDYTGATTGGAYDALQAQIAHCNGATADYHNGSVTGSVASGTGFTGFSPFIVTNDLAVLPVSFTSVKASQQTGGVKVDWSNLTETDIANYAVERSADGRNFTVIGTATATLNNGGKADYSFFDATAADGVNYYRIHANATNGSNKYSIIVKVNTKGGKTAVTIYPNPVSDGKISLQASSLPKGQYTVRIINAAGQSVMSKQLLHTGGAVTTVVELPAAVKAGMYSLQLIGGEVNLTKTFIVR